MLTSLELGQVTSRQLICQVVFYESMGSTPFSEVMELSKQGESPRAHHGAVIGGVPTGYKLILDHPPLILRAAV